MAYSGWESLVAVSAFGAVGILTVLHTLARAFQHERDLHDLRVRAGDLRLSYAARLKALKDREAGIASTANPADGALRQAA